MPGLPRSLVPISFRRGVDTKTDPKQVVPGKMLTLQNATFQTIDSFTKRNGYVGLSTTAIIAGSSSTIAAGQALNAYGNQLTLLDGLSLFAYDQGPASWNGPVAPLQPIAVTTSQISQTVDQDAQDSAYHAGSGLSVFTYFDTYNALYYYSVVDYSTGQILVNAAHIANSSVLTPMVIGNFFVLLYYNGSSNHLCYRSISTSTPTQISSEVTVATNINTSHPSFDACLVGSRLFVAYNNSSGGPGGTTVFYLDTSLTQSFTSSGSRGAPGAITVWGDEFNDVWIGFAASSAVYFYILDQNLNSVLAETLVETVSNINQITGVYYGFGGGGASQIFYCDAGGTLNNVVRTNTVNNIGGVTGAQALVRSTMLSSKAFYVGGQVYFAGAFYSTQQPTYFLFMTSATYGNRYTATVIGKWALSAASQDVPKSPLPQVNTIASSLFQLACGVGKQSVIVPAGTSTITSHATTSVVLNFAPSVTARQSAGTLHLSGGQLWMFDGANAVEHGFHIYPEGLSAGNSSTGGALTDGTYSYIATYEWLDNNGQIHRSAPSLALQVILNNSTTTSTVTVTVPTLRITEKSASKNPVLVVLYGTTSAGTVYFQVGSQVNSTTSDTVTITDALSSATKSANPQLYTTGGTVDNSCTPPVQHIFTYKNRLILIPSDTPYGFWYSQEVIPASSATAATPVEFSDLLIENVDQRDGGLICGAQMDDKMILFKNHTVRFVVGDGPAASGALNDYTPAQLIVTDTGCNNPASLVETPDGLMYQSPKGIYLLDRSLKDHYVGADVEAFNAYTVTSAKLIPGTTQVRFTVSNGQILVYDYNDALRDERGFGQWSVFTPPAAVDATIWLGGYVYLQSNGKVMQESASTFSDAGTTYSMSLTTSWLSLAGLQGYQRVCKMLLLGKYLGVHTLTVQVAYDDDPTVVQTDNVFVNGSVVPYQYRFNFQRQKCQAIQITISDSELVTGTQAAQLSGFTLEVAGRTGVGRVAPNRSFG